MPVPTRFTLLVGAGALALGLSACGGSSSSTTSPGSGGSPTPAAASPSGGGSSGGSLPAPCSFLTPAQVSPVVSGTPTTAGRSASSALAGAQCVYTAPNQESVTVAVSSTINGGPSPCDSSDGAKPVSGLGTCAIFDGNIGQFTIVGKKYTATINSSPLGTQAKLQPLAEDVAPKL